MTYPLESAFANESALNWLIQLAILNGRLFILLAVCLLLIRYFKGSAARQHLVIATAFIAALLLPLSTQWIPTFEIVIEVDQPISTVDSFGEVSPENSSAQVIASSFSWSDHLPLYCLFLYFCISAFFVVRILRSNLAINQLVTDSSGHLLSGWQKNLEACKTSLGLKQRILIRHSTDISSPMTWGFRQAVILIPHSALNWSDDMQRSALLHELAHIKRKDCLSKQAGRLVCALYWINPLCWMALRQFSRYAETASDDMAINSGIKHSHYAQNLLDVAIKANQQDHWSAALSMTEGVFSTGKINKQPSEFSSRVHAILNPDGCRTPINWRYLIITYLLVLGFLLPISSLKASVVQKINYVVADRSKIIPYQPPPAVSEPQPEIKPDMDLAALNEKMLAELEYQRELKQAVQAPIYPAQLPPPVFRELPASAVIKHTKDKIQKTLANIGSDRSLEVTIEESPSSDHQLEQPVEGITPLDEGKEIDLAKVENSQQTFEHLNEIPTETFFVPQPLVEPFAAEFVVTPNYPRRAQARRIEGELLVEFDIDSFGKVTEARIVNAQPSGVFDRAVLKALKKNRYTPQKVDGKAVAVSGVQEKYVFVMES